MSIAPASPANAWRGIAVLVLAAWLAIAQAAPARAAEPDDPSLPEAAWSAMRKVIGDQLAALKRGDGTKAFSYAAPAIRGQFGNPDNFLRMVRNSYDPLLVARYTEFLPGAVIDGNVIQPLRLIGPDNSVLVALYTMERQDDGSWKITGCILAPSTVRAI